MKRISNIGGGNLELFHQVFGSCKNNSTCYNGDIYSHNHKEVLRMRRGFTLAEVLVTLGIIGVVSAMTVPTLMQNYQRKSYVTQLHKVYNEFSQALLQYQTDRNALNLTEAGLNTPASMKPFFHEYFKVVQDCEKGVDAPCFVNDYKNLNGVLHTGINKNTWSLGACVVIASGASICSDRVNGNVFVDVNGTKGPNILGRDAFYMYLHNDGVLDVGSATPDCRTNGNCGGSTLKEVREKGNSCQASATLTDYNCFGKILNDNWEMNY